MLLTPAPPRRTARNEGRISIILKTAMAIIVALTSTTALAAKVKNSKGAAVKGTYTDTRDRFSIDPAPGWLLAPFPGDTKGMNFKKIVNGVPASLHVTVEKTTPGKTMGATLDDAEAVFRAEIGFNSGTEVPAQIGKFAGLRRTMSVFASGDRNTVRGIELYVVHAYGYSHTLHFETLESKRGTFTRDLDRMLASFVPLVGADLASPLTGTWLNTGGGPDLTLEDDGRFQMGPLNGGWQTDGGQLTLAIAAGSERYRYVQNGNTLTLTSTNLGGDLVFRRSSTSKVTRAAKPPPPPTRSGEVKREELLGTWIVLDKAATEPLMLQLSASGSVAFGGLSGRWRFSTGRLTITSTAGETITYAASITNDRLVLSGGDLDRALTLEKR